MPESHTAQEMYHYRQPSCPYNDADSRPEGKLRHLPNIFTFAGPDHQHREEAAPKHCQCTKKSGRESDDTLNMHGGVNGIAKLGESIECALEDDWYADLMI